MSNATAALTAPDAESHERPKPGTTALPAALSGAVWEILAASDRSLRLRSARIGGRFDRWVHSSWRPHVLMLAALSVLATAWVMAFENGRPAWPDVSAVLTLYASALVVQWASAARSRVVVEEFVDYGVAASAGKDAPSRARGLATLLVVELARLRRLQGRSPDGGMASGPLSNVRGRRRSEAIEATIHVDEVSDFLRGAVSTESELGLGPLKLPIGSLMALLGRLVQGPRLSGGLHADGERTILTAQLLGPGRALAWRVEDSDAGRKRSLDEMIATLAVQIFSDLDLASSADARAVALFLQGLSEYVESLRTDRDRQLRLRRAERRFIEALAEDKSFDLAYYNLGVVFQEREKSEEGADDLSASAETSFVRALQQNSRRWDAYYALAKHHNDSAARNQQDGDELSARWHYERAAELCEQAIALRPDSAEAYDLRGVIERQQGKLHQAIRSRRAAVRLAWRHLCDAEYDGDRDGSVAQARGVATRCMHNLGVAYAHLADTRSGWASSLTYRRAERVLEQADALSPGDDSILAQLGVIYLTNGELARAISAFRKAIEIDPDDSDYRARLASTLAKADAEPDSVRRACEAALAGASRASPRCLEETADAYEHLKDKQEAERIRRIPALLADIAAARARGDVDQLRKRLTEFTAPEQGWERGQLAIALGVLHLDRGEPKEAQPYFAQAIAELQGRHTRELRQQGVLALYARCFRELGKLPEALTEIRRAIRLDPLSAFERSELGQNYFAMADYARASDAFNDALLWAPEDPDIRYRLGLSQWYAASAEPPSTRRTGLMAATGTLSEALELCGTTQLQLQQYIRYWLARLSSIANDYTRAVTHYQVLIAAEWEPLLIRLYLGEAHLRNGNYEDAATFFQQAIDKGQELVGQGMKLRDRVGDVTGEPMALATILALSHWGLAFTKAQRDVALDDALREIEAAEGYLADIEDRAMKDHCSANCSDCHGWILFKQGKVDDAVARLETSLALSADAEAYWHLALACEAKALAAAQPAERRLWTQRMRASCEHAVELDDAGIFATRARELAQRLPVS